MNKEEIADLINNEGMGYAIQCHTGSESIADEYVKERWAIASKAMNEIQNYLGELLD